MSARVREEFLLGSMTTGVGSVGLFPRREGKHGWGKAGEFVVEV
jgi:hypothetical protein